MMISTKQKEAMAEIFNTLAEFYKHPDQDFYRQLTRGLIEQELKVLFRDANLSRLSWDWQAELPEYAQLKREYLRCLVGGSEPCALPVESVYKIWTNDSTCQTPIAKQKGYLMGDAAVHIRHILAGLGMELPPEYKNTPDHLTILLELLAYLVVHREPQEVNLYLREHFDWLPDFYSRLVEIHAHPVYRKVTDLVIYCIEQTLLTFQENCRTH
jgi:TorA maturation chaperone TorD